MSNKREQAYPISVLYSAWMLSNMNNLNARAATMGVLLSLSKLLMVLPDHLTLILP